MKKIVSIFIILMFVVILSSCGNKSIMVTFITEADSYVIYKRPNSKLKKSDFSYEQECNIIDFYIDENKTYSLLGERLKDDTDVYVKVNWGVDYLLSDEQTKKIDEIIRRDSISKNEEYIFSYFGNFRGFILFNLDYELSGKDTKIKKSVPYIYKIYCYHDGEIFEYDEWNTDIFFKMNHYYFLAKYIEFIAEHYTEE